MSKQSPAKISTRLRVSTLPLLATLIPSLNICARDTTHLQSSSSTGKLNVGDVFGLVLLMVLPTTLNNALVLAPKHDGNLDRALQESVQLNHDQKAAETYSALLQDARLKPLFNAMLTKENLDALSRIANTVMSTLGAQLDWGTPPHPDGGTAARILKSLGQIKE